MTNIVMHVCECEYCGCGTIVSKYVLCCQYCWENHHETIKEKSDA